MSDTPPKRRRRSLLAPSTPPAKPRVESPDPTIPGFEGVIPDGAEPAEPVALRRARTDEAEAEPDVEPPRPTLLPPLVDDPSAPRGEDPSDPGEETDLPEWAEDPRVLWGVVVAATVGLLLVGAVGGVGLSSMGFALFGGGEENAPETVVVPVPVGVPTERVQEDADPPVEPPPVAQPSPAEEVAADEPPPETPEESEEGGEEEAEGGADDGKVLKIKLPKINFGKKKQQE